MILLLVKYQKAVAWFLYGIFCLSAASPSYASSYRMSPVNDSYGYNDYAPISKKESMHYNNSMPAPFSVTGDEKKESTGSHTRITTEKTKLHHYNHPDIGGPSQPEMSSFQSVNTDNMVNLFTGDFSYNIPLLDVGGYPVNIFYDGHTTMEQEASWVGLGWNINPGTINRNMRGVPDDFDGTDTLIEQQKMKTNKTWGVSVGGDIEECGIGILSISSGLSVGISVNNYLGPAFDFDPNVGFTCSVDASSEKSAVSGSVSGSLSADFNSRTGLTLSPSVSLLASASADNAGTSFGYGLSTSYNSRSGIAALQESEQMSLFYSSINVPLIDHSTTISFAKPSYIPAIRMPLTNTAYSGNIEIGGSPGDGFFVDGQAEAFEQKSEVAPGDITLYKPMVGYLYYQNAVNNANAIMDFTRFNDKEVLPNTPVISAPQYTYDVFSIQGEGTGGSIRAYRNDVGYVRDNATSSHDNSTSAGFDAGPIDHYGVNINTISTPTSIGEWAGGNMLHDAVPFTTASGLSENVYFRNPGENSVLNPGQYNGIGGTDLVRFNLSGSAPNPTILPKLQHFTAQVTPSVTSALATSMTACRAKRTQVVNFLTADEASIVGLDKMIKSYNKDTVLDQNNNLKYTSIGRTSEYRKGHHISEIDVTETNGKRYVYGIPVYNITEKDFTFSVTQPLSADTDKVAVSDSNWMSASSSSLLNDNSTADGYVEEKQIPAYAHSFLLSGVLSPDYVDLTGDGITDDDLGNAVKFNYTRIVDKSNASGWAVHKWRTPLTQGDTANFNAGDRSETKDDKGIVNYGERESWYMHSIESKSMIAIFTLKNRWDGKGPNGDTGGINAGDTSLKRLDRIDLYNKADLKQNGLAKATPIKTVHFWYGYSLCKGTPDNANVDSGKLTLDSISFTFNGQNRLNKDKYAFSYVNKDGTGNPNYAFNGSDRWGNYKPRSMNPSGMSNLDYPYDIQDTTQKAAIDANAGAWSLKKILLPSGGQLEVNYESDDYAYVQNLRATDMMQIVGFSNTPAGTISDDLYTLSGNGSITDNNVVFIKVPVACSSAADVVQKYLQNMNQNQLSFKLWVRMPKGYEYLPVYATIQGSGVSSSDPTGHTIWVSLTPVDGVGPLTLTTVEFLRESLPGQAFPGYDVSGDPPLTQLSTAFVSFLNSFKNAFANPLNYLRSGGGNAQMVDVTKSFVRLNDPDGFKYGGGQRVKSIILKDNWQPMTGQYNSVYGQTYDYTTTEVFNGVTRTISSGVASYEPSVGGEENPFHTILQVEDNLPLGPASYGSIEMPVLDAFFPAPSVGYSKVTVRSINTNRDTAQQSRSGVGEQVTEYYTSKDYPVIYSNTSLDPSTDLEEHVNSTINFFSKYAYDYKDLSQGFLVVNNDMNGKLKAQTSYAENDDNTPVNYTADYYTNTGADGMNDLLSFVNNAQGDTITQGNTGVDVELMSDAREFSVGTKSTEWEVNVDVFYIPWPLPLPFPWPVYGTGENTYRAVTTTKVVNYHSVLDSVVVINNGSQTSTKNLVYDAETGNVIVSRTNNEFNQPVYTTKYPAYWAYSGMGPAYKNIDALYSGVNFYQGQIVTAGFDQRVFESGDELYITAGSGTSGCIGESPAVSKIWAYDTAKNSSSLTDITPHFIFIDSAGNPYTKNGVAFKIVRSGKRNMLDQYVQTITSLNSPVVVSGGVQLLSIDTSSKVINTSTSEYKEKWQMDPDEMQTLTAITTTSSNGCTSTQTFLPACGGSYLEQSINPYCKGLLGNYKAYKNLVFYGNRTELNPSIATNISKNGFISNFSPYWNFNTYKNLIPNTPNSNWVWNNKTTKINSRGLELETKNALNIYTAAQYGYSNNLPVAITNNARSNESGYDGFEDATYNETIDPNSAESLNSCSQQHFFDMNRLFPTQIINTENTNFKAHTGKYVLGIVPGNNTMSFPVTAAIDSFKLAFGIDTPVVNSLVNQGGNVVDANFASSTGNTVTFNSQEPNFLSYVTNNQAFYNNNTGTGCSINLSELTNSDIYMSCTSEYTSGTERFTEFSYIGNFNIDLSQYIYIATPGNYNISTIEGSDFQPTTLPPYVGPPMYCTVDGNQINTYLGEYDIYSGQMQNGNVSINFTPVNGNGNANYVTSNSSPYSVNHPYANGQPDIISGTQYNFTYFLCQGLYKVSCAVGDSYDCVNVSGGDPDWFTYNPRNYYFFYNISNPSGTQPVGYMDLNTVSNPGCASTVPISGNDSMLNSTFSIPAGKKMVFSAWVHEDCGNLVSGMPCLDTTYTNSQVQLQFNNTSSNNITLKPSGPIIDGWQRYEGYFTAPLGATSMNMNIINSSSSMLYFDDIRIHPFNADMKSYVYDPVSQRLVAQLDGNNYATFYEYDEDGTLVRTKAETIQGIKTISETRSAKQKNITTIQQ